MIKKSSTLNLRVKPALKEALRIASIQDHRSIANMVEKLIIDYCEREGITIPEQQQLFEEDESGKKSA